MRQNKIYILIISIVLIFGQILLTGSGWNEKEVNDVKLIAIDAGHQEKGNKIGRASCRERV